MIFETEFPFLRMSKHSKQKKSLSSSPKQLFRRPQLRYPVRTSDPVSLIGDLLTVSRCSRSREGIVDGEKWSFRKITCLMILYRFRVALTRESEEPVRVRGPLFLLCTFNEHTGAQSNVRAVAYRSNVLLSEDQFHCGISNASMMNICASTSRISCSTELAAVDDPCKSWYTLCRTATDTFITASDSSRVISRCRSILRLRLTILFVVLLCDEIDRILNVLVSDLMLVQDALQEIEHVRTQSMTVFTEDLVLRV